LLPGNESRIVRHSTAQQTVVLAKSTKLKHGTKLGRTLCYGSGSLLIFLGFHGLTQGGGAIGGEAGQ